MSHPHPCCGGPHTAQARNPYGHSVGCENYGVGASDVPGPFWFAPPPCVFCAIVRGEAEATIAWRWADAMAIVPLNPVAPGHTLIIPTVHVIDALEQPDVTGKAFAHAAEYAKWQDAPAYNLITSAGGAATQTVFHLHVHVVPRRPGDGLKLPWV